MARSPVVDGLQAGLTQGSDDATRLWLLSFSWFHFSWIGSVLRPCILVAFVLACWARVFYWLWPCHWPTPSTVTVKRGEHQWLAPGPHASPWAPSEEGRLRWGSGSPSESETEMLQAIGWQAATLPSLRPWLHFCMLLPILFLLLWFLMAHLSFYSL